jgi:hypothetical protein
MNRNQLFQRLSGHFLSEHLPEKWHEMSEEELSGFISENTWEPLEQCNADEVFNLIHTLVDDVETLVEQAHKDYLNGDWSYLLTR